jgi:hypothetical protein
MAANVSATAVRSAAAVVPRQSVLSTAIVAWSGDDMTASVTSLIRLEVIEGFRAAARHWPCVTMVRIEAIIHVTMEAYGTMEPRPRPEEYAAGKPVRPIVPIGSTVIRRVIEISVRTNWSGTNIYSESNL